MAYRAYKYTFKLHMAHNLNTLLTEQQAHYHTLKIVLYIQNRGSKFASFEDIERIIDDYLKQYEGRYFNNTSPFVNSSPTVENMGTVFYDHLNPIILAHNFDLLKLEISETPTRIFSISEKIIL
ncbi:MAG TPA: 6-carboxytetrahydropterin synthase [Oscillospiraceae bacterium]|nr:6-carboxytetrahydropterin synthase [Oscillospiraceae bacterium]